MKLRKRHVELTLPNAKVIISHPIRRMDNAKASLTISYLIDKLNSLDINILDDSNITREMIGARLHLNGREQGGWQ